MDNMLIVCTVCAVVSLFAGIAIIGLLAAVLKKLEKIHDIVGSVSFEVEDIHRDLMNLRDHVTDVGDAVDSIICVIDDERAKKEIADFVNDEVSEDVDEVEAAPEEDIHLITGMDYHFDSGVGHSCYELAYHESDDTLEFQPDWPPDSKPFIIANVEECVGDALKFFGINSKEPDVVYVRNHIFKADFKITKVQ